MLKTQENLSLCQSKGIIKNKGVLEEDDIMKDDADDVQLLPFEFDLVKCSLEP